MSAVQFHIENAMVVKNATLAMASLAESDEVSALKVFKDPGKDGRGGGNSQDEASAWKTSGVVDEDMLAPASPNGIKVTTSGSPAPAPLGVEEAALRAEKELSVIKGIPIILKAYEIHKENAEVGRFGWSSLFWEECVWGTK